MRPFFVIVFSFFGVLHIFLYLHLRRFLNRGLKITFWLIAALMLVIPFLVHPRIEGVRSWLPSPRFAEVIFAAAFTWIACVGLSCLVFLLVDGIVLSLRLLRLLKTDNESASVFFIPSKALTWASILSILLILYSFFEAWNVRRVDIELPTTKLPEGVERLRIVQISDVHIGGAFGYSRLQRVMEIVRNAQPDIFVATGDIVDGDTSVREREAALLASHGARWGAFAVTGNHEFYTGIAQALNFIESAGFQVLRNRKAEIGGIIVAGVDDPGFNWRSKETGLLKKITADKFVLFLRHRPYVMPSSEGKFDLQLSGHVHGGQIWPFNYAVMYLNPYTAGLSYKGTSAVYVSNGTGFWGPPMRFLARPEVTVIDLVRKR